MEGRVACASSFCFGWSAGGSCGHPCTRVGNHWVKGLSMCKGPEAEDNIEGTVSGLVWLKTSVWVVEWPWMRCDCRKGSQRKLFHKHEANMARFWRLFNLSAEYLGVHCTALCTLLGLFKIFIINFMKCRKSHRCITTGTVQTGLNLNLKSAVF